MPADLLIEGYEPGLEEYWVDERTATPLGVRRPPPPDQLFAQRKTTILAELGVKRSHGAVWSWVYRLADSGCDPPEAQPKRVAVDEIAVKINGEWSWLYAAIKIDTKLILDIALSGRHSTNPAGAFLA